MGVRVYIEAILEETPQYKKMKAIYDLCEEAYVEIPKEVLDFLEEHSPSKYGMGIQIEEAIKKMEGDCDEGTIYLVDLTKIPKGVTMLRIFYG